MGNITVIKKKYIISLSLYQCHYIIVIISPFTNHLTAGVIIEFQAEITVYCDTCTRETIHLRIDKPREHNILTLY